MAHVAQLVEHVLGKDEVTRSIRVVGSIPRLTRSAPYDARRDKHITCSESEYDPTGSLQS